MKAIRSRWALFMLAWILKTKAEKSSSMQSMSPSPAVPGQGGGGHAQEVLQEGLHPEVGQGRAEEHRGELAVAHPVHVKLRPRAVQQLDVVGQLAAQPRPADEPVQVGVVQPHLRWRWPAVAPPLQVKWMISPRLRSYTPWNSLPQPMGQFTG